MGNILVKKKKEDKKEDVKPTNNLVDDSSYEHDEANDPETLIVQELVARYIHDKHLNSKFIPDFIEKRIYSNMLRVSIGLLRDTLEHTKIEVLGHRITINVTPIEEDDKEKNQEINSENNITTL